MVKENIDAYRANITPATLNGLNVTFGWLIRNGYQPDFSTMWSTFGDDGEHQIKPLNIIKENKDTSIQDINIISEMAPYWFDHFYRSYTYSEINEWFMLMKYALDKERNDQIEPLELMVRNKFNADKTFRESYYKCFTVAQLCTLHKTVLPNMTKQKAIDTLMELELEMPFDDKLFIVKSNSGSISHYING